VLGFATLYRHKGKPLVLKRRVWRADVRYCSNERQEQEAVVFTPGNAKVDGTPDEWLARGLVREAEIRADTLSYLNSGAAA
jgi:hypothetical protein